MSSIIADKQQIQKYYQTMFGELLSDEYKNYWLSINYLKDRGGMVTSWCSIENEEQFVKTVSDYVNKRKNVYVGLGARTEKQDFYRRGTAKDVCMIPGVWVEIDYGNEGHTSDKYPPTLREATSLVNEFPLEPTMVIHSGNGIHAYWLFKEFWTFEPGSQEWERARAFLESFQGTIRNYANRHDWKVDSTHDIARILRVPGTFNFKAEPKAVKILAINDQAKYGLDDLEQYFIQPTKQIEKPKVSSLASSVGSKGNVSYGRFGSTLAEDEIITRLQQKDSDLWNGDTSRYNGDHSSCDLALCNTLAFWTGKDAAQMDSIFRQSGLMRDKWDRKTGTDGRTYGEITIEQAINGTNNVYSGSKPNSAGTRRGKTGDQAPTVLGTLAPSVERKEEVWSKKLQRNDKGKILSNAFNSLLILKNDKKLKGKFAFNMFTNKPEIVGEMPWERMEYSREITDFDDSCLRNYFSINYGIRAKDIIFDALNQVVTEHKYHPIRDYLKSVREKWDGKKRLGTLLVDFFDAEDTELTRSQTILALVGAVKRVFEPGCKMDYVLTLKGEQGVGKSSFFQKLAVHNQWFSDSIDDLRGKDAKEQLLGNWIIELGEMAAVSKGDQKRIKQFITSTEDEFRHAYGRRTIRYPRQCIFVATTNDEHPLKDDTGGRRWWIVEVKSKWFEKNIPLKVDQIWAEAVRIYEYMKEHNKPLQLPEELEKQANKIQSENTDKGLYADEIEFVLERGYIEKKDYAGNTTIINIDETCAFHVWEVILGRYKYDLTKVTAREINATLKNIEGWECVGRRQFKEYGKQTVYKRKDI